ncbi:hypothetical protein Tco_0478917 [Tanacetum coccineum]
MADSAWIEAMQDELHQSQTSKSGTIEQRTQFGKYIIKLKWLWKNRRMKIRLCPPQHTDFFNLSDGRENGILKCPLKEEVYGAQPEEAEYVATSEVVASVM